MDWGVVVAEPQRHRLATESLIAAGIDYFMPMLERLNISKGRHERERYPLFGRYIITAITDQWPSLFGMRGISDMLLTANRVPALVDEDRVEHIRALCVNNIFREPRAQKGALMYGQKVTPKAGPLAYHTGSYDCRIGKNREAAIFTLFGAETRVIFKRGELQAA